MLKEIKILKSHGIQYIKNLRTPKLAETFRGRPVISADITEEDKKLGFIEIATFKPFSENDFQVLTQLGKLVAKILISNFNTNNRA